MRIAYIGHYRDGTGYGEAALNYIESLEKAGLDVVAIPYLLNNRNFNDSEIIKKCELRKLNNIDCVVLHTLPYFFEKHNNLPTIGIFSTEMSEIPKVWVDKINLLDLAVVSSQQSKKCCLDSGVKIDIENIPYCSNIDKYSRNYGKLKFIDEIKKDGSIVFYTISEFQQRKNLSGLLKAYYTAFTSDDKVHLVIKSNLPGNDKYELARKFQEFNHLVFNGLNLPAEKMPKVSFVPEYYDQNTLYSLHNSCDIFVQSSFGESWSYPAFDAMAFGKICIVPSSTGYLEYMSEKEGFLINCLETQCFGIIDADKNLYNSQFNFYSVDINHLKSIMRHCYQNIDKMQEKTYNSIEKSQNFSQEKIGIMLRKAIEDVQKRRIVNMG